MSQTSRELVSKVLNVFKNFMQIFSPKYFARLSCNCQAIVVKHLCECRESVAVKFWQIYNATVARYIFKIRPKFTNMLHKCHMLNTHSSTCSYGFRDKDFFPS